MRSGRPIHGLLATVTTLALACAAPAGAQLRFHSSEEQAKTEELVAALDKARATHLSALDGQRTYLSEALARDRRLLTEREIAERDAFATGVLSANAQGEDPYDLLNEAINEDWKTLVGSVLRPSDVTSYRRAALKIAPLEIEREGLRTQLATLIAIFARKAGKGSYCDENGSGTPLFGAGDGLPEAQAISDSCTELAKINADFAKAYKQAGSASVLLGDPQTPATSGELFKVQEQSRAITALIAAQRALSSSIAAQVKALDAYYQCELKRGTLGDNVRADAKQVQDALDILIKGEPDKVFDVKTFQPLWDSLASSPLNADCTAAATPVQAPAKKTSLPTIIGLLAQVDKYTAKDAILGALRDSALDIQGSVLNEALSGLAAEPAETLDSKVGKRAQAALKIFDSLDKIARARSGRLPDIAGVLVALADVRMRQATAKIEGDRLSQLDRLTNLRLIALRQQSTSLVNAGAVLGKKESADASVIDRALLRYADSWNQGSLPATILANDMSKGRYLPWLDRERVVVDAGYSVLIAAAAQLKIYGKGGVSADTFVQILQAFGLGSIAVQQ